MFKKKAVIDGNEIDNDEHTCKDGIVMRKDSKRTRFSTAISFIEANDESSKNDRSIIPNELFLLVMEEAKCTGGDDGRLTKNSEPTTMTTALVKHLNNDGKLGKIEGKFKLKTELLQIRIYSHRFFNLKYFRLNFMLFFDINSVRPFH